MRTVDLLLPYSEGGQLAELHEVAGDLEREETADGVRVRRAAAGHGGGALRALRDARVAAMPEGGDARLAAAAGLARGAER